MIIKPLLRIPPTVQKHLQADENETPAELIPTYPLSIPDVCECPWFQKGNSPFFFLLSHSPSAVLVQEPHSVASTDWKRGREECGTGGLWCCFRNYLF